MARIPVQTDLDGCVRIVQIYVQTSFPRSSFLTTYPDSLKPCLDGISRDFNLCNIAIPSL
jgi:hypothetical protein